METVNKEIGRAIETLGLLPEQCQPLPADEAKQIYDAALHHFVKSGNRRWWWEDFRCPATRVQFSKGDAWRYLLEVVPDSEELIWFIAEDDRSPSYPVYAATPGAAIAVIGECCGFEYYLIDKDFQWLLCETHHNVLCAVGDVVQERLMQLAL